MQAYMESLLWSKLPVCVVKSVLYMMKINLRNTLFACVNLNGTGLSHFLLTH